MRPLISLTAGLIAVVAVPGARPQAFDVASIKMNRSGDGGAISHGLRHGHYDLTNVTLLSLVETAFGVGSARIVGPAWIASERFDVAARTAPDAPATDLPLMLRALLVDRFELVVHNDKRLMPIYELQVEKSGHKMQPVGASPRVPPRTSDGIVIMGAGTTSDLADKIARFAGRVVVDKTKLSGRYSYLLQFMPLWSVNADNGPNSAVPDLFVAIREQLGLRLKPTKANIDVLIIDKISRLPEAN